MAYYVVYAPDDTVTAISIFKNFAGAHPPLRYAILWLQEDQTPIELIGFFGMAAEWFFCIGRQACVSGMIKQMQSNTPAEPQFIWACWS